MDCRKGLGVSMLLAFVFVFCSPAFGETLSWDPVSESGAQYRLHYGVEDGSYTTTVDVGSATEYSLDTLSLETDVTYYFAVTAYTSSAESGYSNSVSFRAASIGSTIGSAIGSAIGSIIGSSTETPDSAEDTSEPSEVTLSWEPVAEEGVQYRLYYSLLEGDYADSIDVGSGASYALETDALSLIEGATYYFVVTAYTDSAESSYSNAVPFTVTSTGIPTDTSSYTASTTSTGGSTSTSTDGTTDTSPDTSTGTSGTDASDISNGITFSWEPVVGDGVRYRLHYSVVEGIYTDSVDVGSETNYTLDLDTISFIEGATYYFTVTAYTDTVESDYSGAISYAPSFFRGDSPSDTQQDFTPPSPPAWVEVRITA